MKWFFFCGRLCYDNYCSHFLVSNYSTIYFIFHLVLFSYLLFHYILWSEICPVEAHVRYAAVKKKIKVFLTPTDKLDELKAQLNRYFIHIGENQRTSHVVAHVSCVDLGEDKEEDFWKPVYFPQLIKDDIDVDYMFRLMVQNNILHLYIWSIEV